MSFILDTMSQFTIPRIVPNSVRSNYIKTEPIDLSDDCEISLENSVIDPADGLVGSTIADASDPLLNPTSNTDLKEGLLKQKKTDSIASNTHQSQAQLAIKAQVYSQLHNIVIVFLILLISILLKIPFFQFPNHMLTNEKFHTKLLLDLRRGNVTSKLSSDPLAEPVGLIELNRGREVAKNGIIDCVICGKSFRTPEQISQHFRKRHNEHSNKAGNRFKKYTGGVQVHRKINLYTCPVCFKKFNFYVTLQIHMRTHDDSLNSHNSEMILGLIEDNRETEVVKNEKTNCAICKESFPIKEISQHFLSRHKLSNTAGNNAKKGKNGSAVQNKTEVVKNEKINCGICKESFSIKEISQHFHTQHKLSNKAGKNVKKGKIGSVVQHKTSTKHTCSICFKTFNFSVTLQMHMRIHSNNSATPSKKCDKCLKDFQGKNESTRSNETLCTTCNNINTEVKKEVIVDCAMIKKEPEEDPLQTHRLDENCSMTIQVDNIPKEYNCDFCTESFQHLFQMKAHCLKQHEPTFICDFCEQKFYNASEKILHIRQMHMNCECALCKLNFTDPQKLLLHLMYGHAKEQKKLYIAHLKHNTNRTKRKCCNDMLESSAHLWKHNLTKHLKALVCANCKRKFANVQSIRKHMGLSNRKPKYTCEHCQKRFMTAQCFTHHWSFHTDSDSNTV